MGHPMGLVSVVLTMLLVGCASAQSQTPSQGSTPRSESSTPGRTLVLAWRRESALRAVLKNLAGTIRTTLAKHRT